MGVSQRLRGPFHFLSHSFVPVARQSRRFLFGNELGLKSRVGRNHEFQPDRAGELELAEADEVELHTVGLPFLSDGTQPTTVG